PRQFVDDGTAAAESSIPERPTTSVVRASAELLSQTLTRIVSEPPSRDRSYARRRTGDRGSRVARGDLAGKSSDGGAEEKRGQKTASFHDPSPAREPPSTKGTRKTAVEASFVFDWSAGQVERWVGETMELGCYREAFQAKKGPDLEKP
ncbi:unnamed protein product, partial [Ectocarpus sp. 8 AP-2014]